MNVAQKLGLWRRLTDDYKDPSHVHVPNPAQLFWGHLHRHRVRPDNNPAKQKRWAKPCRIYKAQMERAETFGGGDLQEAKIRERGKQWSHTCPPIPNLNINLAILVPRWKKLFVPAEE